MPDTPQSELTFRNEHEQRIWATIYAGYAAKHDEPAVIVARFADAGLVEFRARRDRAMTAIRRSLNERSGDPAEGG